MKEVYFSYKNSLVVRSELELHFKKLEKEIKNLQITSLTGYDNERSSINLPKDKKMLNQVKELVNKKLKLKPSCLVVVGIGGSNLGTVAVQEALLGKLYNLSSKIKILYADTVDSDSMKEIISVIEPILKNNGNVLINCISKSGTTTETIANFEVMLNILKKYKKDYEKYVVVTSDEGSKLWSLAKEKGFDLLAIPKLVGGRYSVFSPVGLFPLGILGLNIDKLLDGAKAMVIDCLSTKLNYNIAAQSAIVQYINYKKGKNISDLFLFSNDLESIGKFSRQLLAESLGKDSKGITPTVSIGSTDLHSLGQLYLGGPYDKITTFVSLRKNKFNIEVSKINGFSGLVNNIEGKKLSAIMDAILNGVKTSFVKGKRPFMEIVLEDKSEKVIGGVLQFKMIEVMYLGYLLNVNPFDQPNVEAYKVETRKLL